MSDITEEPGMEEIILRIQSLIPVVKDAETLVGLAIQLDVRIEEEEKDEIKVVRRKLMAYLLGDEIDQVEEDKLYGIYEKLVHETTNYPEHEDVEAPTAKEGFTDNKDDDSGVTGLNAKKRRESFGYGLGMGSLFGEEVEEKGRNSVDGEKDFGGYGFANRTQYGTQASASPFRQPGPQAFRHPAPQPFRQSAPQTRPQARYASPFSPSQQYFPRQSSPSAQHFQYPQFQYPSHGVARLKECKISGVIGSTKAENRLDYDGLASQIQSAMLNYQEPEILDAVIKAIAPSHYLRNYLESRKLREELTLLSLMKVMKSHFTEKDTSKVFHEMSNAIQKPEDSPHTFCVKMLALRDKILNMSADGDHEYPQKLVQSQMQHSIYTGFRKTNVRQEMRMLLKKKDVSDDELLEMVAEVMLNETEHEEKVTTQTQKKKADTSVVQNAEPKPPKMTPMMQQITDQLTALGTKMQDIAVINAKVNELTGLKSQFENFKTEVNTYCNRNGGAQGGRNGPRGGNFVQRNVNFQGGRGGGQFGGAGRGNGRGAGRGAGGGGRVIVGSRRYLCDICVGNGAERCDHCFICHQAGHNSTNCTQQQQAAENE